MRVDQRLRAWIATLPGIVVGKTRDLCYAEVAYEIGGDFSNQEVRDALDRAGYLIQDRMERNEEGEYPIFVIPLPEQPFMG